MLLFSRKHKETHFLHCPEIEKKTTWETTYFYKIAPLTRLTKLPCSLEMATKTICNLQKLDKQTKKQFSNQITSRELFVWPESQKKVSLKANNV